MSESVGRVLGTQDAMPLDFWVGVAEGQYTRNTKWSVSAATRRDDGSPARERASVVRRSRRSG